jgi:small-conductance mechanosensitive channel
MAEISGGQGLTNPSGNMSSLKQIRLAAKSAVQQQQIISELNALVKDIERCDKTILALQSELAAVNSKYPAQRTTQEDVAYLTDLLKCAKKKLGWEKQIASLQKRTPRILQDMSRLLNDPDSPPSEEMRAEMLRALQGVQGAMERLQSLKAN